MLPPRLVTVVAFLACCNVPPVIARKFEASSEVSGLAMSRDEQLQEAHRHDRTHAKVDSKVERILKDEDTDETSTESLSFLVLLLAICSIALSSYITSGGLSGESQERKDGDCELIQNPAFIGFFQLLLHHPRICSFLIGAMLCGSCSLSPEYDRLKYEHVKPGPFHTRLKDVQLTMQHDFKVIQNKSDITVLFWEENLEQSNLFSFSKVLHAADAKIRSALKILNEDGSCKDKLAWSGHGMDAEKWRHSEDDRAATMRVTVKAHPRVGQQIPCFSVLSNALREVDKDLLGFRVAAASENAMIDASLEESHSEANIHLLVSAPVMVLLLRLGVGTSIRAVTPFLCLGCTVAGFRAVIVLVKWVWSDLYVTGQDTQVVFVLLALSFDYGLFFWARFSEERQKNRSGGISAAVLTSLRTSGYVIAVSMMVLGASFIVCCSYPEHNRWGYLASNFQLISGFAILAFYSLTVPALLVIQLPSLFDEVEPTGEGHASTGDTGSSGAGVAQGFHRTRFRCFEVIGEVVTRSPWKYVVPVVAFVCCLPLLNILRTSKSSYDSHAMYTSKRVPEYDAHHVYRDKFDLRHHIDVTLLLQIVPLRADQQPPANTQDSDFGSNVCKLAQLIIDETKNKHYKVDKADIRSMWWDSSHGKCFSVAYGGASPKEDRLMSSDKMSQLMQIRVKIPSPSGSDAQEMTNLFWDRIEPRAKDTFKAGDGKQYEFRAFLDTPLAEDILVEGNYRRHSGRVMIVTVIAACFITSYCFNSAFVAVKLLLTVVVPILAEYGILVCVFQYGCFTWLGIGGDTGVYWTVWYITPGFLLALAIDYDMFLFARVYERRLEGYDNRSAVRIAFEETGPPITLAGSLMIVAFFFILLNSVQMISQIGCLYCFGVAVDTFFIRVFIAPAVLCISEDINYWPQKMPPATKTYDD